EADRLARLDRRPRQDDAAHAAGLQRLDRLGHRQIGLAGAGRPQGQHQITRIDRLQQRALALRLGPDGLQIGLVAILVPPHRRPAAPVIHRQSPDLGVVGELAMIEHAFASLTLERTLGHGSLQGMKKGEAAWRSPWTMTGVARGSRPGAGSEEDGPLGGKARRRTASDTHNPAGLTGPGMIRLLDPRPRNEVSNRPTRMMVASFPNG